ncbi:MAG: hypothetical protein ACYDDE_00285 [bacterium]
MVDDSYSKRESNSDSDTLIPDNFYESKSASIFDDDFQGIEWPVVDDLTRFTTSLDITDLRNLLNPSNPLNNTSMFNDD